MLPPMISFPCKVMAEIVPVTMLSPLMVVAPEEDKSRNVTIPENVILALETMKPLLVRYR